MVPLPGHTSATPASRCGAERGWLLHAGDAYFHHARDGPRAAALHARACASTSG